MGSRNRAYDDRDPWRWVTVFATLLVVVVAYVVLSGRNPGERQSTLPTEPVATTPASAPSTAGAVASPTTILTPTPTPTPATTTTTTSATTIVSSRGPLPTGTPTHTSTTTTPTTAPDDEPAPVVAIFDIETITLAGAVPTQAARERLTALVRANSKTPAIVIDLLTIDPAVSPEVGVRVIELNSTRFPPGEPTITMEHGAELQRMVTFMKALPDVTVTVVGHADQHGADGDNLALSRARAEAVVSFMIDQGIDRDRLSAVAVGESELLTLEDDEASLALNRRTEFVVFGALVP
jgi:outer membrane protein OmpA-like peptidoglycan-associated protein